MRPWKKAELLVQNSHMWLDGKSKEQDGRVILNHSGNTQRSIRRRNDFFIGQSSTVAGSFMASATG